MLPTHMSTLLAEDRQKTFLDEAESHRRARQLRASRSPATPSAFRRLAFAMVPVRIRPIRPTDDALLADGFARLSDESHRLRFLSPKHELSRDELRYFTHVDHHDHEALVAVTRFGGRGLGVARYVRHRDDPTSADVAVTVVDKWQ